MSAADATNPLVSREKRSHHFDHTHDSLELQTLEETPQLLWFGSNLASTEGSHGQERIEEGESTVSLVPTAISGHHKAVPPTGALLPSKCAWMRHPHHNASAPQLNLHCPALWEGVRSLSCWTRWVESHCQHRYYFVLLTKILSTLSLKIFFHYRSKILKT